MSTELQSATVLTNQEDSFALAIIEYGGNLGAAYRSVYGSDVKFPIAKAQELLCRPEVAKRVQLLSIAVEEHAHISLGSHLMQLAHIRDLGIETKQLKVALTAERSRGEAVGFYNKTIPQPHDGERSFVTINFVGSSPTNVQDWAAKHGKPPLIIDVSPKE
jgi:hypothetical protein